MYEGLHLVTALLHRAKVTYCIIGELALNYYNVPRVLHDLELAILDEHLARAEGVLKDFSQLFVLAPEMDKHNIYVRYKFGFPRFRCVLDDTFVTLFNSSSMNLPLSPEMMVVPSTTVQARTEYSKEFEEYTSIFSLIELPVPCLAALFQSSCKRYLELDDATAAIAAEQLVDGMDLDSEWLQQSLPSTGEAVTALAMRFILSKSERIDDFSENTVSCFIKDQGEAIMLRKIAGRDTVLPE